MGTEVASRPPLPPGSTLGSISQGPGRKKHEKKISRPGSTGSATGSSTSSGKAIYARDYHLRIQGRKYSLSSAIVCIGAKIHTRYSPSTTEESRSSYSQPPGDRDREVSNLTQDNLSLHKDHHHTRERSKSYSNHDHHYKPISNDEESNLNFNHKITTNQNQNVPIKDFSSQDMGREARCLDFKGYSSTESLEDSCLYTYVPETWYPHPHDIGAGWPPQVYNGSQYTLPYDIRRGLSRVTLDEHPTSTLEIVDHTSLPQGFSDKIVDAIKSYRETPVSSGRSSPTIEGEDVASSSRSTEPGCIWGTGNTTERSDSVDSQYSWDEFDRQAAKTVQNLFDEIDSVLFERRPNQAEYIYNECQEWGSQFPHLRLLGRQLLQEQESGYEMIERDISRPNTTSSMGLLDITDQDLSGSQDSQGLSVSGRGMRAIIPPVEARSRASGTPSTQSSEFSHLEEEVFDCEGEYEEIIAVDFRDIYENLSDTKKQLTPRRRPAHYPPITPNACLKDSVASSAFDCIWQEIISWIRPLLKKYSLVVLVENKPINPSLQNLSQPSRNDSSPGPPSRENTQSQLRLSRAPTMNNIINDSPNFDGILQIRPKIPIQREKSQLLSDPSESQLSLMPRPGTSIPMNMNSVNRQGRPSSTRYLRAGTRNLRLAPIDRSKTPSVQDDEKVPANSALLVRKINPPGIGRISSPPFNNPRNGAPLPPIGTPLELDPPSRFQKKMLISSRASSAVDKDLRVAYKDRYLNSQDTRPSTTHAFRSETPIGRRASTPLNNVAFNPPSRNSNFGPGMNLDIRGSGLQPSHDIHGHLGIPQEILEDHEGLDEHIHPNQWTPSTPSHNNPYSRRSRHFSSLVR